jgi:hypothetical protein
LGPIAFVLGSLAHRSSLGDPQFSARGPVLAAIIFGVVITFANWVGFALMYLGLHRSGVL